jgi:hypothetical protein
MYNISLVESFAWMIPVLSMVLPFGLTIRYSGSLRAARFFRTLLAVWLLIVLTVLLGVGANQFVVVSFMCVIFALIICARK